MNVYKEQAPIHNSLEKIQVDIINTKIMDKYSHTQAPKTSKMIVQLSV